MNQDALPESKQQERLRLSQKFEEIFSQQGGAQNALKEVIESARPEDVADALALLRPFQRLDVYRSLSEEEREVVVEEADPVVTRQLLADLNTKELIGLVKEMSPDDATDVVAALPNPTQSVILNEIEKKDPEQAEDIRELLEYAPDTAGGLMTTEFATINEEATAGTAITAVQGFADDAETINTIYVTNLSDQLVGVVSIRELLTHKSSELVADFMETEVITAAVTDDRAHAAALIARYNLQVLPIIDNSRVIRGIITIDDVIDALQEEFDEDLFLMAGTAKPEYMGEKVLTKAKKRLPWLLVTLALGMVLAIVLRNWDELIGKEPSLAFFLPVLAAMAGNAGIQASTLMVRALASEELGSDTFWRLLSNEFRIGLLIGTVCGTLSFLAATFLKDAQFGIVVSVGMMAGIINATLLGTFIPLACHRLNVDPALSAGPFITTLNDVLSLVIYLSLANAIIGL